MVRTTFHVRWFACLLLVQTSLMLPHANANTSDLSYAEDLVVDLRTWNESQFELDPNCRFATNAPPLTTDQEAIRRQRLARVDELIGKIANCGVAHVGQFSSCPCETEIAKSSLGRLASANNFDPHFYRSTKVAAYWASLRSFLRGQNEWIESSARLFCDSTVSMTSWANAQAFLAISPLEIAGGNWVKNGDWRMEFKAFPKQSVPAKLAAFRKQSVAGSEPTEELIKLAVPAQDSYWQYYDDCDRWGVDFSNLIVEAIQPAAIQPNTHEPQTKLLAPSIPLMTLAGIRLARQFDLNWQEIYSIALKPLEYCLIGIRFE